MMKKYNYICLAAIAIVLYILFQNGVEGYGCGCSDQPELVKPFYYMYDIKKGTEHSPLCSKCKQWPDQCKCYGSRWWYPLASIVPHDPYA